MPSKEAAEPRGLTRRLIRWLVRRYYPDLEITGADHVPRSGPVLFCANHANSLLDPVMIGIAAGRPVRFMAKAPLFDHPILGPPMSALGMIPAFRGSDNSREVRRNIESLDVGAKVLVGGHAMGIFPEGKSTDQAHLEMIRSGAARMAIQAAVEGAKGLRVVPIGISYQRKDAFRSAAWVRVGEPIDVHRCLADHDGDERKARRALTGLIETRLKEVVVHLDEPEWEPWLEDLQTLVSAPDDRDRGPAPPLHRRKRIADAMNYFLANDRARAEAVADQIASYRDEVHAAGLGVDSPVLRMRGPRVCGKLLWNALLLILLFMPAMLGTLHHLIPFVLVRLLAKRLDQPGRKTISTNRMLVGVPLYLLWYVLVACWMLGHFSAALTFTWLAIAPFCGIIAIHYWRRAGSVAELLWHELRVLLNRSALNRLRAQQSELRGQLFELADEYERACPRPEPA